jgi:hypothetical protein
MERQQDFNVANCCQYFQGELRKASSFFHPSKAGKAIVIDFSQQCHWFAVCSHQSIQARKGQ